MAHRSVRIGHLGLGVHPRAAPWSVARDADTLPCMVRLLLLTLVLSTGPATATTPSGLPAETRPTALRSTAGAVQVARLPIGDAVVRDSRGGTRGPVSAALEDGRVLLGGGRNGRRLLVLDPSTGALTDIGRLIRANQRLGRFKTKYPRKAAVTGIRKSLAQTMA